MRIAPFLSPARSLLAAAASLAALAGVVLYLVGPSWASPDINVAYTAAARQIVTGVLKDADGDPMAKARVRLVFRSENGRAVKTVTVRTDKRGRFKVPVPRGSARVVLTAYEAGGSRTARGTLKIRANRSVKATVIFPGRGGGLLPSIFPY